MPRSPATRSTTRPTVSARAASAPRCLAGICRRASFKIPSKMTLPTET